MRGLPVLASTLLASSLCAQSFVMPPGTLPSVGTCNAFPFSTTNMRYQALITAADLSNTAGSICCLSLAPCTTGVRSMATITVKMAHFSGAAMTTTFDSNLNTPGPAVTVLDSVNYQWIQVANAWNDIGLQNPFAYNGVDNLVVEVLVTGSAGVSGTTHRDATNQRVYLGSYTGQLTGTNGGLTAFKMRVSMGDASTQLFGAGCAGSAGTPAFSFIGTAQLGQVLGFDCVNTPPLGITFMIMGNDSHLPVYPLDLGVAGAPGCTLYHNLLFVVSVPSDGSGRALTRLQLPQDPTLACLPLYFSYLVFDPPANALGLTSSNYGRAVLGF
jgi:hypothetical protein